MGGKVAVDKTTMFATSAKLRARLKRHTFVSVGGKIPLKHDGRDLGTHLDLTRRGTAGTLTRRLALAAD
eukprot:13425159-Alexandrium_andersonii.AAC.1